MTKINGSIRGYTLVELVITIMISGMLFFAVGTIIVQSEAWWTKQSMTAASFDDQMYARKFIEWQIKSSTGPYIVRNNTNEHEINYFGHNSNVDEDPSPISSIPDSTTTQRRIYLEGQGRDRTLRYDEWKTYAGVRRDIATAEVIVSSVTHFLIVPNPPEDDPLSNQPRIEADIERLKGRAGLFGFHIQQTKRDRTNDLRFVVNARNESNDLTDLTTW